MYSVTAMTDQLNWQKLDYFTKIIEHQIHILTDDIPPPAPTQTIMRSSHEKSFGAICENRCMQIFILPTHSFSME